MTSASTGSILACVSKKAAFVDLFKTEQDVKRKEKQIVKKIYFFIIIIVCNKYITIELSCNYRFVNYA